MQGDRRSSTARSPLGADFSVEAYISRLQRPVEFAIRDGGRAMSTVRNLGSYLSQSAAQGLEIAGLRTIHPELRRLRDLAAGYDALPTQARKARLTALQELLAGMGRSAPERTAPVRRDRRPTPRLALASSVAVLPGVGARRAALLHRLGVERVEDLLWRLPWRYVDRQATLPLGSLRQGQDVTVCGEVRSVEEIVTPRRRLRILQAVLRDASGMLTLKWFNQPYLRSRLAPGQLLMCSGRVKGTGVFGDLEMDNPQFEVLEEGDGTSLHTGRIVPIYHETRGLNSRALRVLVHRALNETRGLDDDCLPGEMRERLGLTAKRSALSAVHFPPADADLEQYNSGLSPGHQRLVFEELLLLELGVIARRLATAHDAEGVRFRCPAGRLERLWRVLPFEPTQAQRRVVEEVRHDMMASRPMNRLIQGDVGCGKTVVAAAAIWMAVGDGYQAALMAPTELLAEQHARQLSSVLGPLGVRVALITSDMKRGERTDVLSRLANGAVDCIVGTHALLQPGVRFAKLGFAVVDEQHKFGVVQRSHLVRKGYHPDVLIMTATPIPRTLAMTVYGDLEVSVVDQMPPGRVPIETRWYPESQRSTAYEVVRRALAAGQQAYVVAPRIDESDEEESRSAIALAQRLRRVSFPDARIGLLHGRMKRAEKDALMRAFLSHHLDILVATTVIEVGIDVPNATVMMIEHADRYGLAQLHQLRGRVGRGSHASTCLLLSPDRIADEARQRLETLQEARDGFLIAERDLALRGPGEFLGTRQSGLPDLKVANLLRDARLVDLARREAIALLERDPTLSSPQHAALRAALSRTWGSRLALAAIG